MRAFPTALGKFPTLMEMSKIVIRKSFHENHQLPCGIEELQIPNTLKRYLNLEI